MKFSQFNFNPEIQKNIKKQGYEAPTPIQEKTIPLILKQKDVMGLAQTGTGKTAAFVLPILQQLIQRKKRTVRALVIAPTRELTEQINTVFNQMGRGTGLKTLSIYGGISIRPQITTLKKGVDIITACPGRLLDHIQRKTIDVSRIDILVLDEADQMFDMGFLPDIKKIIGHLPRHRQTLMFSATMPEKIKSLADQILDHPETVNIGYRAPVSTVDHAFLPVKNDRKTELLKNILDNHDTGPVLVFTRTKLRASRVAEKLFKSGYHATALHGNLSQDKRKKALYGFDKGKYKVLVATDVAARGIDVSGVSHVINYDIPDTVDAYTHRIGRTGRANRTGDALTFVTSGDKGPAFSIQAILGDRLKQSIEMDFFGKAATHGNRSGKVRPKAKKRIFRGKFRNRAARQANPYG